MGMSGATWDTSGLRRLSEKLKEVAATKEVSALELFSPEFMRHFTTVRSFEKLIEVTGLQVNTPEDFKAIPNDLWERVVKEHTRFSSWLEMQQTAGAEYFKRKLSI
jgi:hypothetical protein